MPFLGRRVLENLHLLRHRRPERVARRQLVSHQGQAGVRRRGPEIAGDQVLVGLPPGLHLNNEHETRAPKKSQGIGGVHHLAARAPARVELVDVELGAGLLTDTSL